MPSNTPFKPSPLSFGSPRASPFRRPSTPNSPPTPGRQTTPGSSPGRGHTPVVSPSKLNQSYTVEDEHDGYEVSPRTLEQAAQPIVQPIPPPNFTRELPPSPTKRGTSPGHSPSMLRPRASNSRLGGSVSGDAAANLTPVQLREIREAFQVLDRDNDGSVDREDVADVLGNIGLNSSALPQFFPPGAPQTINFPTFLTTLSNLVTPLSSRQELLNALAAFDDDDSGQIDVAELRDALLHTVPDGGSQPLTDREIDEVLSGFTGRRVFGGKSSKAIAARGATKRGEVFRYQEFVAGVMGGTENANGNRQQADTASA